MLLLLLYMLLLLRLLHSTDIRRVEGEESLLLLRIIKRILFLRDCESKIGILIAFLEERLWLEAFPDSEEDHPYSDDECVER